MVLAMRRGVWSRCPMFLTFIAVKGIGQQPMKNYK